MKNLLKIEIDPKRIFGLDLLRACAILFVVIVHGGFLMPHKIKSLNALLVFDGVSIFFVLSGFLIGGILIKILERSAINRKTLLDFWIRRWFRTLPNYLLIVCLLAIYNILFTPEFSLWSIRHYFIFSQNLITPHPKGFFSEAWSLSIEEWFYLLIPILIFVFIKIGKLSPKKAVLFTAFFVIVAITGFRYFRFETMVITNESELDVFYRKQVFTRLDSLMYGVIGAYLQFYSNSFWQRYKKQFLLIGLALFLFSKVDVPYVFTVGGLYSCVFSFSLISLATLLMLPYLSTLKMKSSFLVNVITYISLISYSMYLLNLTVIQKCILKNLNLESIIGNEFLVFILNYSLYWILTIVLSILLYKYFEIPCTTLRDNEKVKKWLKLDKK